jgi:6-phosphogluconolactonase (cycloisomerase 2 family)
MKAFMKSWFLHAIATLMIVFPGSRIAGAATQYVVTNDDVPAPFTTGVSFFSVAPNGLLTFQQEVLTGGFGIASGFFGANRIAILNSNGQSCVYASEAGTGSIAGISVDSLTVGGVATGSATDQGTSNGIGILINYPYLYAGFSDSNTIGTFQIQAGCGISFLNDVSVGGLAGGIVNGMAAHGHLLVATYTDGTIESFDVSGGTPLSNGDKQGSSETINSGGATYPNSVAITRDGHYAIFGDTATLVVIEVSDISSGKLTKTKVYRSGASISSSNIMLSPDETLLYIVNTQGDRVSAGFFDKSTGKLSGGCSSGRLLGLSENFSYLAGVAAASQNGNGGGMYVAEFGTQNAIAMVKLSVSGKTCTLHEVPGSPVVSELSSGLLSIGRFPPVR